MLEILAEVAFAVVCSGTGHALLWALTLGRWEPSDGRDDFALLAGLVFWAVLGVAAWLASGY